MATERDTVMLENMFRKTNIVGIAMSTPMKHALIELSRIKQVSLSYLVRSAVIGYLYEHEPMFREEIYHRILAEQAHSIKGDVQDD